VLPSCPCSCANPGCRTSAVGRSPLPLLPRGVSFVLPVLFPLTQRVTFEQFSGAMSAFPAASSAEAEALLAARRQELFDVIMIVLRSDACFKYTQGFHDFCAAVLHVIGSSPDGGGSNGMEVVCAFICAVGKKHLRASLCDANLEAASAACGRVFRALFVMNQQLAMHLESLDVNHIVCVSWILTLFAHPLSGHKSEVTEVLDFIFASDDDYTVLLCACIIADNASSIMQLRDGGEAFKAVLDCPKISLLPSHRRRMCLCQALQISLSKYNQADDSASPAVARAAAAASCPSSSRPASALVMQTAGMRPCVISSIFHWHWHLCLRFSRLCTRAIRTSANCCSQVYGVSHHQQRGRSVVRYSSAAL
jgi:hypothetical protein